MIKKNLGKNCPVSMLYNIAEPDKAYDKCHHLLNPFTSNETSHFYQMYQSIFVFRVVGYCYSNFNRASCKQTVEGLMRHGSVVVDSLLIVTPDVGFCNCSMICYALLYVHSIFAIILMGKRDLVALLSLSSWCFVIVVWLFLAVPWVCLQFVIVVFPDDTHLLLMQSVASDLGLYYLSMSHKKNARLMWVKYFCCICYSHHLYCFFIELDNNWI